MHRFWNSAFVLVSLLAHSANPCLGFSWRQFISKHADEDDQQRHNPTTNQQQQQQRDLGFFINGARESKTISGNPAISVRASVRRSWRARTNRRDRRQPRPLYVVGTEDEEEENAVTTSRGTTLSYRPNLFPDPTTDRLPNINRNRDPLARWERKRVDMIRRGGAVVTAAPTVSPTSSVSPTLSMSPSAAPSSSTMDIVDTVQSNPELTVLAGLLEMANLISTLRGEGPWTLFAPTDSAFDAVTDDIVAIIMSDATVLSDVLLYHVLPEERNSTSFVGLDDASLVTVQGTNVSIFTDIISGSVNINNANIITPDIVANNGIVHTIDTLLLPDISFTTAPTPAGGTVTTAPTPATTTLAPTQAVAQDTDSDSTLRSGSSSSEPGGPPLIGPRYKNDNLPKDVELPPSTSKPANDLLTTYVCEGEGPQDIALGIHLEATRPPRYQFEECTEEQLEALSTTIETSLNMAFPFTVSKWPGTVRFSMIEFDPDQFTNNEANNRKRHLLRRQHSVATNTAQRQMQETETCPASPVDCPDAAEACLFACGIASVADCSGDLALWEHLESVLSVSLSALSLPCLGHPNPPKITLSFLQII